MASVPLFVKDPRKIVSPSAGVSWKADFDQAMVATRVGGWAEAAENLVTLAGKVGDPPVLWRNIRDAPRLVGERGRLREAARKFASLDVPWEDAAEAEAMAAFLTPDALGDEEDLGYRVQGQRRRPAPVALLPPRALRPGGSIRGPWPKRGSRLRRQSMWYAIVPCRPPPRTPRWTAFRGSSARRSFSAGRPIAKPAWRLLGWKAGIWIASSRGLPRRRDPELGQPVRQEAGERLWRSLAMLHHNWRLPQDSSPEQIRQWIRTYREDCLLKPMAELSAGALGGQDAARGGRGPERARTGPGSHFALGILDGLGPRPVRLQPTSQPIGAAGPGADRSGAGADPRGAAPRLYRVVVKKLKDEDLLAGFHVAASFATARRFALSAAGSSSVRRSPGGTNGFRP